MAQNVEISIAERSKSRQLELSSAKAAVARMIAVAENIQADRTDYTAALKDCLNMTARIKSCLSWCLIGMIVNLVLAFALVVAYWINPSRLF